jgi:CubicO group peptidase (beta-lactamase class C family)
VLWQKAYGFADLVTGRPMATDTVLFSGSMGKIMTATAVMQLVETGVIGLDDPVEDYLPFPLVNPLGGGPITIHDLLVHRSGLNQNGAVPTLNRPAALPGHLRRAFETDFHEYYHGALARWARPVGEKSQYSNTGMALLGLVVEDANPGRLSFSDYVQQRVIDPLGMASTQFPPVQDEAHVRPGLWSRLATGYSGFGGIHVRTPTLYLTEYPAGTAVTTPGDLCRLALAHLGDGALGGARILEAHTARRMRENETGGTGPHHGMDFGLMWMLGQDGEYFGHGGAHMFGWSGWLTAYPREDLVIVVMTNEWTMVDATGDAGPEARLDIPRAAAAAVREPERRASRATPSWAWKVSYLAGIILGERTLGLMGVRGALSRQEVDGMIAGTFVDDQHRDLWDEAGFRAGIQDIEQADHTVAGIEKFMASAGLRVPRGELDLLYRDLGGSGMPVLPLRE